MPTETFPQAGARSAMAGTNAPALVQVAGLKKTYGPTRAVADVSFEVRRGEILGFLGPNGAGKSTTLKIMTGYIAADAGTVKICGHDIALEPLAARRKFGYLPEALPLYPEMQVVEYLEFIAASRELVGAEARQRVDSAIERLGLTRMRKRLTGSLSKGYKQRVGLAQAILHDPEILILDEPTNGLDPQQIIEIRQLLSQLAQTKALIFSTHILQEISAICTRVMIIRDGQLIANGTPEELGRVAGLGTWEIVIGDRDLTGAPMHEFGLGDMIAHENLTTHHVYRFSGENRVPNVGDLAARVTRLGGRLEEVRRPRQSLEQAYLQLTGSGRKA
ncbi:MAG: ABC transporter ATP-binding protein [Planctomycetota bacterium]